MNKPRTDAATSRRMSRQAQKATKPEATVRFALHSLGKAYRLNVSALPGSPDIANRRRRWAVFVHGCFWHQHPGCPRATVPKRNRDWWLDKFDRNKRRDAEKIEALESLGFDVLVVWECLTVDSAPLASKLESWFDGRDRAACSNDD